MRIDQLRKLTAAVFNAIRNIILVNITPRKSLYFGCCGTCVKVKGGIYENLVLDILSKNGHKLHYHRTDNGSVEVEFLISKDAQIIPIEVKAGNGSTISLNTLLENPDIPYGYKLISGNVGVNGKKIVLPLYMAMFI